MLGITVEVRLQWLAGNAQPLMDTLNAAGDGDRKAPIMKFRQNSRKRTFLQSMDL